MAAKEQKRGEECLQTERLPGLSVIGVLVTSNDFYLVILLRICAEYCKAVSVLEEAIIKA